MSESAKNIAEMINTEIILIFAFQHSRKGVVKMFLYIIYNVVYLHPNKQ